MSDQKTEQPTPKKLRDARKKGQVAFSRDTSGALLFLVGVFGCFALVPKVVTAFEVSYQEMLDLTRFDRLTPAVLTLALERTLKRIFDLPMALILALSAAAIAIGVVQTQFNLSAYPLQPRLEKLNPLNRLKQWFGAQGLFEFAKTLLKLVIVFTIAYWVFQGSLETVLRLIYADVPSFSLVLLGLLKKFLIFTAVVFLVFAAIDFLFQRWNHERELKMSKDEVKREYKESEGDPHIKSHRRGLHLQLAMEDVRQAVSKANVVVTNPTHYAVALRYQNGKMVAPIVTAKGQDTAARRIRAFARRDSIPMVENKELARALFQLEVRDEVPPDLYAAVAEVLAFVERLKYQRRRELARFLRIGKNVASAWRGISDRRSDS
jgi:flagellar biosynthetic protein FlhB